VQPRALLAAAMFAFAAGYSALAVLRHLAFSTGRFDLGNMTQAVWSTAHGRPLEMTSALGVQFVRLGAHVDPILVLFAPLWPVWPDPTLLLVSQAAALASGALPIFWIAERHLRSTRAALGFALAYLLSPAVGWMALADFHAVALATPLLLFAFWALDDDRIAAFAIFALLAAATKEHVPLVVAGLGLWYGISRGRLLVGGVVAAAGAAWTAVALGVLIPHFSPRGEPNFYNRYEAIGGSFTGVARTLLTDPSRVAAEAFDGRTATYVLALLGPLVALPLLSPLVASAALPEVAINVLSSAPAQTSVRHQYSAATLAVLFPAAVLGATRVVRGSAAGARLSAIAVALTLVAAYLLGPLPLWRALPGGDGLALDAVVADEHDRVTQEAAELVPPDVAVSATSSLGAHLSARRTYFGFPNVARASWVAVDTTQPGGMTRRERERYADALRRLRTGDEWRLAFARDGVLVYRRGDPPAPP